MVRLPNTDEWDRGRVPLGRRLIWYTGGSMTNEGSGAIYMAIA